MNLDLKARVIEANIEVVDINGFKYSLHKIELGTIKSFPALIPVFDDIDVGDCISSNDWSLTRLRGDNPPELCLRFNKVDLVIDARFKPSTYLNAKVVGIFLNSEKCYLRTVGSDAKPFYMATLRVKDHNNESFSNTLIGFRQQAMKLSTLKKGCLIDCEVTVREKKDGSGYELSVIKVDVLKEDLVKSSE